MATIGSFKKVGNDFQGEIITLSLQAKGVRIVAETRPVFRQLQRPQPPHLCGPASSGAGGPSAPRRVVTTYRSSSTIRRSNARSTRT